MELLDVSLPLNNQIASKYVNGDKEVFSFFDYHDIQNQDTYNERLMELRDRIYPREALTEYLLGFHNKFITDEKTYQNINRLKDPNSVVVIGGQQAGLLTGPLYTIHKIISIIKLAKEQEQLLNVPVIPVFWVAGEDHDFAEINHVYISKQGKVEKRGISQKLFKKCPASSVLLDKKITAEWINEIVESYGETSYTNDLLKQLYEDLHASNTYVDFFIRIIFRLFPDQGLVVVDSGDEGFRKIGAPFTRLAIFQNEQLGKKVLCSQNTLQEMGYGEPIERNEHNAHLFFVQNGERILLERYEKSFVGKNNECNFDETELLHLAENSPQMLSNNVVTRPLMQEYVFPTLAFISGPGEIAYWAVLKEAFHLFGFKVPPIIPRLMLSIIDRKTDKYIKEKEINLTKLLKDGCHQEKKQWLESQTPYNLDKEMEDTVSCIICAHKPFKELAMEIDANLTMLAEKNAEIIKSQINFLKQKMENAIYLKNQAELKKFDHINLCIKPLDAPQERIWNIFYYINAYGFDFIDELLNLNYKWNGQHKVIFI